MKKTMAAPSFTGRTYQKYRKLFLAKPGALETFPFGPGVAVYKAKGKLFATLSPEKGVWYCNLKCDPLWALALRKQYPSVQPGYHMNKKHWNTLTLDGSLPDSLVRKMAELSYVLVSPPK
ncbi:MAG TPA: MmcQ/YjbR family DNA-binding protein [bacterium]|jgi:predicted DNA-binding protein (MmcQ/YjbR family)|nr:MmcQ/YjbR family DNA-binding protein [bacterium]